MNYLPLSPTEETTGKAIVNAAYAVHTQLGPGLLESIYETCMVYELRKNGFDVKQQVVLPILYDGIKINDGLRLDILVDDIVIIELKAVEALHPIYEAQIISYLKLADLKLGFLINFNVPLVKQGIKRFRL
jgi:GxxExxY protein